MSEFIQQTREMFSSHSDAEVLAQMVKLEAWQRRVDATQGGVEYARMYEAEKRAHYAGHSMDEYDPWYDLMAVEENLAQRGLLPAGSSF